MIPGEVVKQSDWSSGTRFVEIRKVVLILQNAGIQMIPFPGLTGDVVKNRRSLGADLDSHL